MFVDEIRIEATAGKGGDGIVAYRREFKVEKGGPFGGNGGKGGSIFFICESGINTLLDFRYLRHVKGTPGEKGRNKGMTGGCAEDTYIKVPIGTTIRDEDTGKVIADLTKHGETAEICKGGRGGRGNMSFASGANKCPDFCEKGEPGEHRNLKLELKVLADCGLVGFPSVGKSTLIAAVSSARPKVADYHFTTLNPNLGMVMVPDGRSFVMADLPGLIKGASSGIGLGFQFLRHIERCRVIIHVIDISGGEGRDPYEDYVTIREELQEYQLGLLDRPEIIVLNKIDEVEDPKTIEKFISKFDKEKIIIPISAIIAENTNEVLYKVADTLAVTPEFLLYNNEELEYKEYGFVDEGKMYEVQLVEGVYEVTGKKLEKLFLMTDFNHESSVRRFARQLRSFGLDDELRRMGAQTGDLIRIFDFEFEFID